MTTPAAPSYDELAQELADTKNLVASLQANQGAQVPTAPKAPNKVLAGLKKFAASVASAFTTPEAIKAEKSLAVVALTRLAILLPSAAVLIDVLSHALGGPAVGNP